MGESGNDSGQKDEAQQAARWSAQGMWPRTFSQFIQVGFGLAVIVASIRLTAIAEGNPQLAGAILASSGYIAPLASLLFSLVPFLLFFTALYLWEYWRFARRAGVSNWVTRWAMFAISLMWLALLYIGPWVVAVGLVGSMAVFWALSWLLHGKHWKDGGSSPYRANPAREVATTAFLVVFSVLLLMFSDSKPWLPKEVIETESGSYVGYLLNVDAGWATILVDDPRYLRFVKQEELVSRTQCQIEQSATAMDFVTGRVPTNPNLPECD